MPESGGQGLQIFADPLTLFQPRRVDYAYCSPPQIFRPSDIPARLTNYATQLSRPLTKDASELLCYKILTRRF